MAVKTVPSHFPKSTYQTKFLEESAFLDWAMAYFRQQPLACFLDSAGPIHDRSQRAILSGEPMGLFLQKNNRWQFWDSRGQCAAQWDQAAFVAWLETFHQLQLGPTGPTLFPLLSYEAFNETPSAPSGHPIWPNIEAVWLLTRNSFHYDRPSQTLRYPTQAIPTPGKCQFPQPQFPGGNIATGWRETQRFYEQKMHEVKQDIFEGNYYQANLSQRFLGTTQQDPLDTYSRMRTMNPSPFMGIFRWGPLWVLSGSPERLIEKKGRAIATRPIAGTQPRNSDMAKNAASIRRLITSEKERAEHLMLVDLARNDLGRIATPGSVRVPEFAQIESYSHVHHLVSQVEATLRPEVSVIDTIAALFPGGTVTGAPKIACMKKLVQLEGEARGPYTGSFGFVDTQTGMDLNILIRTLIQREFRVCFHAGGGIVADSEHDAEYRETRLKAAALMEALQLNV